MNLESRVERYPFSEKKICTVKWSPLTVDANVAEIRGWCKDTFGKSGYREETDDNRWVDNIENGEIMFVVEADMTMFLLRWQ